MRIAIEGWGRNHGEKVLFAEGLASEQYRSAPGTIQLNQYEVTAGRVRIRGADKVRVRVRFGINNLRTGGDYQGKISFSPEDAALIFALCFRDEPMDNVLDALAKAREGLVDDDNEDQAA